MNWRRWVWIGLAAAGIVALVVYGYRPQPVLVDAAEVVRGPMQLTIEEEGKTRVTDRFVVFAPVAGNLRRITLKVGDPIAQNQVLAWMEPLRPPALDPRTRAEAEARVRAAEEAVKAAKERAKSAQADVVYWKSELERVSTLLKSGDMAKANYDRALNALQRAEAALLSSEHAVGQAEAELEAARATLEYTAASEAHNPTELVAVRAPVSGRVLKVVRESAGVAQAGEPLLEIANARSLEVVVEVLSADAVRINPGTRVLLERWGGEAPLEGRVRRIEPVAFTKLSALGVEEQRVYVIVDITSPPDEWRRLGDQYRVEAKFILWEAQDVPQIPASALFRYEGGWAVFVIEDGHARRRKVEIGRRNGLVAEVLSGLQVGEKVIPHPDDKLEDGAQVTIAPTARTAVK